VRMSGRDHGSAPRRESSPPRARPMRRRAARARAPARAVTAGSPRGVDRGRRGRRPGHPSGGDDDASRPSRPSAVVRSAGSAECSTRRCGRRRGRTPRRPA
jgi:hypothetical protein